MSQDCYFYSSDFKFKDKESQAKFHEVLPEVMDDYAPRVKLEPNLKGGFSLSFDTQNVGDSFQGRVSDLASELGPLVSSGFRMTIVTDSMNEENTDHIYGGPDQKSIEEFEDGQKVEEALGMLNPRQRQKLIEVIMSQAAQEAATDTDVDRPRG